MPVLEVETPDSGPSTLAVERIVNCGYTGRDEAAVQAHIDELAAEGVPAPDDFPTFYPKPHHLLATPGHIKVVGDRTSGEAEFVLVPTTEETYVGVGSDHTDRDLERTEVLASKLVCQNVVGETLWPLSAVQDHWDELALRSWVVEGETRTKYQETTLDAIRPPSDLLSMVEERLRVPLAGTAVFSGSVATETEELRPASRFEAELYDPELDRQLTCEYDVSVANWLSR